MFHEITNLQDVLLRWCSVDVPAQILLTGDVSPQAMIKCAVYEIVKCPSK